MNPLGLSIIVTAHNEAFELTRVLSYLCSYNYGDLPVEVVVQVDSTNDENVELITNVVKTINKLTLPCKVSVQKCKLDKDFAQFKNHINTYAKYKWILQLDADEELSATLLDFLMIAIIMAENEPESMTALAIPRLNLVQGITRDDINQWGWQATRLKGVRSYPPTKENSEHSYLHQAVGAPEASYEGITVFGGTPAINWPDYQVRLYKNQQDIRWVGKVHEQLRGAIILPVSPEVPGVYLIHSKNIHKQRAQNNLYQSLHD